MCDSSKAKTVGMVNGPVHSLMASAVLSPEKLIWVSSNVLNKEIPVWPYDLAHSASELWKNLNLSSDWANSVWAFLAASDSAPKWTITSLLSAMWVLSSSQVASVDGGPVFFKIHETMVSSSLPPVYSWSFPLTNHLRVGNPWTPNLSATFFYSVASTLAR